MANGAIGRMKEGREKRTAILTVSMASYVNRNSQKVRDAERYKFGGV